MPDARSAYRELLRVAQRMLPNQRAEALAQAPRRRHRQARAELAKHRDVRDAAEVLRLVKIFQSKTAYARMCTPRKREAKDKVGGRTVIAYNADGSRTERDHFGGSGTFTIMTKAEKVAQLLKEIG
ncbi:hypothetical protein M885DRAFT_571415 [Pelagophyceae sp. CCMP2097]|nr:hypothetical protein M885DRAFT_571415 [Pelagophyceae sp. CCMP2097]